MGLGISQTFQQIMNGSDLPFLLESKIKNESVPMEVASL